MMVCKKKSVAGCVSRTLFLIIGFFTQAKKDIDDHEQSLLPRRSPQKNDQKFLPTMEDCDRFDMITTRK